MIYTTNNSSFPDQIVSDAEKATYEYGLAVGRAIEGEWFSNTRNGSNPGYAEANMNNYNLLRLYARGEQPVQKYKDELAINGDLSYLNLDWKPVPVVSKFVDIVVNGISQRSYDINAYAQDPACTKVRTDYANDLMIDINARDFLLEAEKALGIDSFSSKDRTRAPQTFEELEVHLQMDFKQSVEVAEEEVINQVLDKNKFELTRQRINYDLTVLGIGAVKTNWNKSQGVTVDYVDPSCLVYSYTEDPNFEDIYYVGEVKAVTLADLKMQFPDLTDGQLETIQQYPGNQEYLRNWNGKQDNLTVQVLYFEYKTLETLYSGAKILGHPLMLDWRLAEHMTRPIANTMRVNMNYQICAPRMYKGRIQSLVGRITGFADMIQLTHLKIQQVMSRVVPDGVYLDMDGLAEVDLGNGTNYNPAEALNS